MYLSLMTDDMRKAVKRAIKEQTEINTASPHAARAALIRMGIYTEDGKVAPPYDPDVESFSVRS